MNSHGIADFAHELQAVCADQLPACILSQTGLAVPAPPGLVLPAFSTEGYVRETDTLVYVEQDAHTVTLTGADGTYWLALSVDTWTAYAQWTTEPGTAYRWRPNATQPADVAGLLTFASVTVAGGAITAVSPLASVTRAAAGRALLGLGTLATQNADAVNITGGTATFTGDVIVTGAELGVGVVPDGTWTLGVQGETFLGGCLGIRASRNDDYDLVTARHVSIGNAGPATESLFSGRVAVGAPGYDTNGRVNIAWNKQGGANGLSLRPLDGDGAGGQTLLFLNTSGGVAGTISQTATTVAYNTSSDVRLKFNVQPLTDSLALIRRLNPISHLWNIDDSYGESFLAHELQREVPLAVTGEPDAVNDDGSVKPQQVDASKLIPRLTAGIQELLAMVESLTARVTTLEQALGL